jgi:hypothetical protein
MVSAKGSSKFQQSTFHMFPHLPEFIWNVTEIYRNIVPPAHESHESLFILLQLGISCYHAPQTLNVSNVSVIC